MHVMICIATAFEWLCLHVLDSNWSDHAVVISKARNWLHPSRSIKMVYIKSNHRALGIVDAAAVELKMPTDVTPVQVRGFGEEMIGRMS